VGGREVGAVASGFVQRKWSLMLMRSDINGVCVTQWCSLLGDKPKCSGQALSSIFRILDYVQVGRCPRKPRKARENQLENL